MTVRDDTKKKTKAENLCFGGGGGAFRSLCTNLSGKAFPPGENATKSPSDHTGMRLVWALCSRSAAAKARKAKRVSKVAKGSKRSQRSQVFRGKKAKTAGGTTKDKLTKNKRNKIVSKKASANAKKTYQKRLGPWNAAVAKARKALGCKGFVAIKKGSALYNKAKGFYGKGSPKK